jgi:hypothetical protein
MPVPRQNEMPNNVNAFFQASQKEETYSEQIRVVTAKHKEVNAAAFQFWSQSTTLLLQLQRCSRLEHY